ncbi:MAG: heavy metal-binding domain-containing protein [Micromonosporaceae bacterium]|nr:heavy metal-binding domain-containing protein [Micromonosporaceae bacterium]
MLVVTTPELSGYRISEIRGLVIGVAARPRNKFTEGVRALRADAPRTGEGYVAAGRHEAVERMVAHARNGGANAILNMRFDHRIISEMWVEICAYGTSVIVEPLPTLVRRQRTIWSMRGQGRRGLTGGPITGVLVEEDAAPDAIEAR